MTSFYIMLNVEFTKMETLNSKNGKLFNVNFK